MALGYKTIYISSVIIIALQGAFGAFSFLEDLTFRFLNLPMARAFDFSLGSVSYIENVLNIRQIIAKNRELELENARLLGENIELKNLRKENEFLKKALNLRLNEPKNFESANIFWISQNFLIPKQ